MGDKMLLQNSKPELVFAVVAPAGARLSELEQQLKHGLSQYGYTPIEIRLSKLLQGFAGEGSMGAVEAARIRALQAKGDAVRERARDAAALARAGICAIRAERRKVTGGEDSPAAAHAYILHQLKRPEEVSLLRSVYGSSFIVFAGHAPRNARLQALADRFAQDASKPGRDNMFEADASAIIEADQNTGEEYGQNVRDAYPKADFFVDLSAGGAADVARFIELLFGHPFRTPRPEEYAMFQAHAASLRSSDPSRQVGAAIVRVTEGPHASVKSVDVTALGMNEVPKGGGGFYWDTDSPDRRDQALPQNRADAIKLGALTELIDIMRKRGWLSDEIKDHGVDDLACKLDLRGTQFRAISEFGRTVHAEMAAIIDAARRGVSVEDHSMYVTTFPCHNCAKHIIGAGLRSVIYLEPYPKSHANYLHGEEVVLDPMSRLSDDSKVVFYPFTGVAPRQYGRLFSRSERRKQTVSEWSARMRDLSPAHVERYSHLRYLAAEMEAVQILENAEYQWDPARAGIA